MTLIDPHTGENTVISEPLSAASPRLSVQVSCFSPRQYEVEVPKKQKYQNVKEEKFPNYLKKELIYRTKFDINHIIKVFT